MKRFMAAVLPTLVFATTLAAQGPGTKPLDIYVVDTEGGKAALFVSPTGQSLLIDTGNPGGRDTDRIMEAVTAAGLKQIDFLISTHYHVDHIGGMAELVKRIPVGTFIDHGPSIEEREQVQGFQAAYAEMYGKAKRLVVKPGDKVPITGLDWRIVTSAAQVLKTPLPGGGRPNPACASFTPKPVAAPDDNAQSVGSVVTLGQFRLADFGDLLWNNEHDLMCPNNPIGTIDLYMVTHHGLDSSGSPAVVHGLAPRVALMQNGTRKGAGLQAMTTMRTSPGLEDIWQLHWGYGAGIEQNSAGVYIANVDDNATIAGVLTAPQRQGGPGRGAGAPPGASPPATGAPGAPGAPTTTTGPAGAAGAPPAGAPPTAAPPAGAAAGAQPPGAPPAAGAPSTGAPAPGAPAPGAAPQGAAGGGGRGNAPAPHTPAYMIKVSARPDGSFTVTNTRNGFTKTYAARPRPR
jgi:beta-lactamase superfamily II metal-dependent hydrolase